MFCVIQQVEIKKVNRGEAKRIEVYILNQISYSK